MLDENLPTFDLKSLANGPKHRRAYFLSHHGSDPAATYSVERLDPSLPNSKNCYAVALFDAYNPATLYGEVLIRPAWTQPSLSADEIRRNGGVAPPPQPVVPNQFTIQLYNPEQQIVVEQKSGSWGSSASYEFSMPVSTFRQPSASALDRQQDDPTADATIPKINFAWKKEGKLSKDFTCFMTGRSTDKAPKKWSSRERKEPDIAVALFQGLHEVTLYESNWIRVDLEDPKGLEICLLLAATVLKDVFFSPLKEAFNVNDPRRDSHHTSPILQPEPPVTTAAALPPSAKSERQRRQLQASQLNPTPITVQQNGRPSGPSPPPTDPRTEWEHSTEAARLRAESEAEARRLADQRRRQAALDEAEVRRLARQAEVDEKARKKELKARQAEIDRETARLKREYGAKDQAKVESELRKQREKQLKQQQKEGRRRSAPQTAAAAASSSLSSSHAQPQHQHQHQHQTRPPPQPPRRPATALPQIRHTKPSSSPHRHSPQPPQHPTHSPWGAWGHQNMPSRPSPQRSQPQPPSSTMSGALSLLAPGLVPSSSSRPQAEMRARRSFLGLRTSHTESSSSAGRLAKKQSSMW